MLGRNHARRGACPLTVTLPAAGASASSVVPTAPLNHSTRMVYVPGAAYVTGMLLTVRFRSSPDAEKELAGTGVRGAVRAEEAVTRSPSTTT